MSIEINFEALSELSIADLKCLWDWVFFVRQRYHADAPEFSKYSETLGVISEQLGKKTSNIFIF